MLNIRNKIILFINKFKKYYTNFLSPERRVEKILLNIHEQYPELFVEEVNEKNNTLEIIKTYHSIKNIETQKICTFIIIILTAINVLIAFNEFQSNKSFIVPDIEASCSSVFYPGYSYKFNFVNVGNSPGIINISVENISTELRLYPEAYLLVLPSKGTTSITIYPKPFEYTNNFSFTIKAINYDDKRCTKKTCSFMKDSFTNGFKNELDEDWSSC